MESLARSIGVSVPVFRFLVTFAATVPCGWAWRLVSGPTLRHTYAAFSGLLLSHFAFGAEANILFAMVMIVGYGSMLLHRRSCGLATFVAAFSILISWQSGSKRMLWRMSVLYPLSFLRMSFPFHLAVGLNSSFPLLSLVCFWMFVVEEVLHLSSISFSSTHFGLFWQIRSLGGNQENGLLLKTS